ncbi:hypothetical protein WICMUC_002484 [Wickerhamomyces mucosus]|uniref:Uncharacterized protein n=1 Tax=Wickerhamomyces mucosus TaxID=1378264 RepID=A0A9P8PP56_9ASCO|nr:hypothetical protein WICMUC_002484 [Wickerhamomyces mucosus]
MYSRVAYNSSLFSVLAALPAAIDSKVTDLITSPASSNSPVPLIVTSTTGLSPLEVLVFSTFWTTSNPSKTSPNTTCLPFNHEVTTVVMKNCEPFVFLPALAIDKIPGLLCFKEKFSSSNLLP